MKSMMRYLLFFILITPLFAQVQITKKKKLYISDISVSNTAKNIASNIPEDIKENVLKTYGDYYHVVTDMELTTIYKDTEEIIEESGCNTNTCRILIANSIEADEITYGRVISKNESIFVNLTNLEKNQKNYNLKATKFISFLENEYNKHIRMMASELIDPEKKLKPAKFMYFEELTDPIESITELEKLIQLQIIKKFEKLGDFHYNTKKFEKSYLGKCKGGIYWCNKPIKSKGALDFYQNALTNTLDIKDETLKKLKQDHIQKKMAITKKTGMIFLINYIEQLLDRATSFYVYGQNSKVKELLKHARTKMLNSIFTTKLLVDSYNILAKKTSSKLIKMKEYNYNNEYKTTYSNKTFENSLGMEFILIPEGEFVMGCSVNDKECEDNEKPRHNVKISKPFYMSRYEVTQGQWKKVMGYNPSHFKACGDNCPVEQVGWPKVKVFIKKLNKMESRKYRLPTEAEWEYAARAGTTYKYFWGDKVDDKFAWYSKNSKKQTHTIGERLPNPFGLYDMSGNVWEWVEDCYEKEYYNNKKEIIDPINKPTKDTCKNWILRGGSWYLSQKYLRVSERFSTLSNSWYYANGFRLVSDP